MFYVTTSAMAERSQNSQYPRIRRNRRLGVFVATGCAIAMPASASTYTLHRAGAWEAFGGTSNDGTPLCGVIASGQGDKFITMKYFANTDYITLQVSKTSWKIPNGTQVRMSLQFGNESPWAVTGNGQGEYIHSQISAGQISLFFKEFRLATNGLIRFLDGTEGGWTINLNGSSAAIAAMAQCMTRLPSTNGHTQPFDNNGSARATPTQPFNNSIGVPARPENSRNLPSTPAGSAPTGRARNT